MGQVHVGATNRQRDFPRHFTLEGLRHHLKTYVAHGYLCEGFESLSVSESRALLLRHDIDLDVGAAIEVATVEAQAEIQATYFVLMTSPLYNPQSAEVREQIRTLRALGHSIALHYDPTLYDRIDIDDHCEVIFRQASELSALSDGPVGSFSAHRPATNFVQLPDVIDQLHNAYAPGFCSDIAYSSDSGGWWRHGCYQRTPDFAAGRSVQLVLHPIWWVSRPGELPQGRLERLVMERRTHDRRMIADCVSPYAAVLGLPTEGSARWPTNPNELRP